MARLLAEWEANAGARWQIDLPQQCVVTPSGDRLPFDIDPFRTRCLLAGLDDIALTLQHADEIRAFEQKHLSAMPWLTA